MKPFCFKSSLLFFHINDKINYTDCKLSLFRMSFKFETKLTNTIVIPRIYSNQTFV